MEINIVFISYDQEQEGAACNSNVKPDSDKPMLCRVWDSAMVRWELQLLGTVWWA